MSDKKVSEKDLEEAFEDFFGETLPDQSDISSLVILGMTALAAVVIFGVFTAGKRSGKLLSTCLLYTSDAADDS